MSTIFAKNMLLILTFRRKAIAACYEENGGWVALSDIMMPKNFLCSISLM